MHVGVVMLQGIQLLLMLLQRCLHVAKYGTATSMMMQVGLTPPAYANECLVAGRCLGSQVHVSTLQGHDALIHAAWKGHVEVIAALLAAGANVNTHGHKVRPLHHLRSEIVRWVFQSNYNVRV